MLKNLIRTVALVLIIHFVEAELSFGNDLLDEHSQRPLQAESTMEALEPWETPVSGFFVRSHHGLPALPFDQDSEWTITVDGLVEKPMTFKLSDLKKLPIRKFHAVLECSGNWRATQKPDAPGIQWRKGAVGNAEWEGIALAELLLKAGIKPNAKYVQLKGADLPSYPSVPAFIRSVPLNKILRPDSLIALKMNRELLPPLHGGPVRLILPGWYGENWVKWLTQITLTEAEDQGFYMKRAYRIPKEPIRPGTEWDPTTGATLEVLPVQSILVYPVAGQIVSKDKIYFRGKAFSGSGTIKKVEISVDQGKSWQDAVLEAPRATGGWQEFRGTVEGQKPGSLLLLSRATDSEGNQQPLENPWNPGGYGMNRVDSVLVNVAQDNLPAGQIVLESKCLVCHSRGIIENQRLTSKQWDSVLKKMESFGAQLDSKERESLLSYLSEKLPPGLSPELPNPTSYEAEELNSSTQEVYQLKGNIKKGQTLFKQYCMGCHGAQAQGQIGPRLAGRAIPPSDFWLTVTNGKRMMPSFKAVLKRQEIADIQSFLRKISIRN